MLLTSSVRNSLFPGETPSTQRVFDTLVLVRDPLSCGGARDPLRVLERVAVLVEGAAPTPHLEVAIGLAFRFDAVLDLLAVVDGFTETFLRSNEELIRDPGRYLADVDRRLAVALEQAQARDILCSGKTVVGAPPLELLRHVTGAGCDAVVLAAGASSTAPIERELGWRTWRW